ncbi:MAG TPA: hypothetical protein VM912_00230 [Terriglobales bacterium]|nr:hypothetical protein [Terriglobales bacterium]
MSSADPYPPTLKTLRCWRGVFVLSAALIAGGPVCAQGVGDVYSADASVKGSVRETSAGLEINNGAVITAGEHSASLRLARGGQVRICPGTNLTVNSSPEGQQLMFAMSAGSLEADYRLPFTADVVLTPDYRILISGPAAVSLSITATQNGDACVRARGDNSYVVVSELIGDDFYRINPDEQVVFHAGHVKDPEVNGSMSCGCPPPAALQRAEAAPPLPTPAAVPQRLSQPTVATPKAPVGAVSQPLPLQVSPQPPVAQAQAVPTPEQRAAAVAAIQNEPAVAATASAAAGLPAETTGPVQVQIDALMVFKGTAAQPDVTATLARVHIEHLPWPQTPPVAPEPPSSIKSKSQIEGAQK